MRTQIAHTNRLLTIDAAYAKNGYAVMNLDGVLEYGLVTTKHDDSLSPSADRVARITEMCAGFKKIIDRHNPDQIVIEMTDWQRGARDNRNAWIIETKARESLAIGTSALIGWLLAFRPLNPPLLVGPCEWMRELGVQDKDGAAHYVAMLFRDQFELSQGKTGNLVVIDAKTKLPVPRDVTDAIAMGVVVRNRMRVAEMVCA